MFTLHTALAEFMLAGKAFDTYIELVSKGKARVEKSGEDEVGLDDDGTVLRTTAAGLQMLCCYGRRKEVERAQDIALVLEKWLEKIQSPWEPVASAEDEPTDLRGERSRPDQQVSGEAIAAAHHSLGVCRAHWARLTFETSSRPELQAKAIASFRAALESTSTAIQSAEIHFALASILAETREIGAAIECAKKAIALYASDREAPTLKNQVHADTLWEERCKRGLFKAWHLLSFLLSARQDFANAIAACDAANELYNELFESAGRREAVERLALSERQSIIELKMSQLVLWEILDGPEEAVNACGDLLGAYKQFFVSDGAAPTRGPTVNLYSSKDTISPPQTANGTVRRSLLGRSKVALPSLPRLGHHSNQTPIAGEATPGVSRDTNIPSTLDGSTSPRKYQPPQHLARQESKKLHKRRSRKSMLSEHRTRGESSHGSSQANGSEEFGQALPLRFANVKRSSIEASHNGSSLDRAPDGLNVPITHNAPLIQKSGQAEPQRLPPTTSISTHHRNQNPSPEYPKPPTSAASKPSPIASQSSYPLPEPLYSSSDLNRHSLTLLARIWLLIARLYRDAGMPVDAQGAVSEASNQARLIEAAVTAQDSSAEALSMPGWGKLKSVAEVWADVHAEQASLCLYNRNQSGASEEFEKALGWFPDHNAATVGLSNMLLDYYDDDPAIKAAPPSTAPSPSKPMLASLPVRKTPGGGTDEPITANSEASSALLSRLASRDRAYGLLSMLTKSGRGWDDSEAWSALARVYEQSGQIDKAKEALWWVVELEDSRPLREWSCIGEL